MAASARAHLESLLAARKLDVTLDGVVPFRPDAPEPVSSGLAWLDARLGGGWPRGEVSEVAGPRSSGRSWVAAHALARVTQQGELAALVDATDSCDPASLGRLPVHWPHLLWVRGQVPVGVARTSAARARLDQELDRILKAAALVLSAGGFGVVVIDLSDVPAPVLRRLPFTTWLRLARLVEGRDTACLVLAPEPITRSARGASVRLEAGSAAGEWAGAHACARRLAGLLTRARLTGTRWRDDDRGDEIRTSAGDAGARGEDARSA